MPLPVEEIKKLREEKAKPILKIIKKLLDEVNDAVKAAADSGPLQNVLHYSTLPVVSTDIIGNPHSSIFDAPFTRVVEGNFVKTLNWYDNEWGYSNRVADLLSVLHSLD